MQGFGQGHGLGHGQGGLGPSGNCICSNCGYKMPHQPGVPCSQQKCPKCGTAMVREGAYHDKLIKGKKHI